MHLRSTFLSLVFVLLAFVLWAQDKPTFVVEGIGLKEGLPTADIQTLFRDHKGFLWLGTDIGLVQYDGLTFKSIQMAEDGRQLGLVHSLLEDQEGCLWVATEDGLFIVRYDKAYSVSSLQNGPFVRMKALLFDKQRNLWCGTGSGIYQLSLTKQQQIKANPKAPVRPTSLLGYEKQVPVPAHRRVFSLALDEVGRLYIGGKYDLFRYQPGKSLERIWQSPKDGKTEIWSIAVRSSSDIVFSVHDQFCYVRLKNGQPTKLLEGIVPADVIWDGQAFWFLSYGLKRLLPTESQPTTLLNLYEKTASEFTKLLIDREGIFWVATNEGLWKIRRSTFERIALPDAVAGGEINGFGQYNGQLVFGAHHGRVFTYSPIGGIKNLLNNLVPIAGVAGIQQDYRGTLWLATTYQGLLSFDKHTIKKYTASDGLGDEGFNHIIPTRQGDLWAVGDVGITQIHYDSLRGKYQLAFFEHPTNRYRFTIFYGGIQAQDKTLWLASDFGLISFRNGRFYNHSLLTGARIRSIRGIAQDKTGNVWLATDGQGLWVGKPAGNRFTIFRHYSTQNGLASNTILTTYIDSFGNIWTGSANGLNCLSNPGTVNERVRTFTYSDGFFADSFQQLRFYEYPAGTLWIGSSSGLMQFQLNQLSASDAASTLLITDVQLRDTPFPFSLLSNPVGQSNPLELAPTHNALTFSYALTSLSNPAFNRYHFRLIGAETEWRTAIANERTATYSGLSPGSYTFQVAGIAANGLRSQPVQFSFIILPPFWQRTWFIVAMVLLLGSSILTYVRWREKRVKQQETEKSRVNQLIAELETRAIRSQMNPHFIFNCLNAIQECILADDTDTAYRYLSKFSRLLRLVLEESTKNFHTIQQELDILRLYLSLEALRFGDTFSYEVHLPPALDTNFYQIPALLLQPLVENAIRHGLLHKMNDRKLCIKLSLASDNEVVYVIEDNGIGRRHAAELSQRTPKQTTQTSKGISLIQERLVLLEKAGLGQTSLQFEDLINSKGQPAGTRVTIKLPLISVMS